MEVFFSVFFFFFFLKISCNYFSLEDGIRSLAIAFSEPLAHYEPGEPVIFSPFPSPFSLSLPPSPFLTSLPQPENSAPVTWHMAGLLTFSDPPRDDTKVIFLLFFFFFFFVS